MNVAAPWTDRFGDSVELGEVVARGPWAIVPWRARFHCRGSGLEVEAFETYAVLVRDGQIVRVEEYRTTEEALEAVGGFSSEWAYEVRPSSRSLGPSAKEARSKPS